MKIQLILLLGIFTLSCNSKNINSKRAKSRPDNIDTVKSVNELVLVKPDNISLKYTLDKNYSDTSMGQRRKLDDQSSRLKCIITNNNNFSVFLVGYTCSDLPGKLKIVPNEFYDWQFINCNVSWPDIHKIEPNKSLEFSTNLRSKGKSQIESLGMYVKFVDRLENYDTLKKKPELIKTVIYIPYENCSLIQSEEPK